MIIYKATNTINGKFYIGQTINYEKRKKNHLRSIKYLKDHFHCALKKWGVDNFIWEILDASANNQEELDILEIKYIEDFKPKYNSKSGGHGGALSQCVKDKISKSNKGKTRTIQQKNYISLKTKEAMKKFVSSKEYINPMKHFDFTKEHREKLSKASKNKKKSLTHCANIKAGWEKRKLKKLQQS